MITHNILEFLEYLRLKGFEYGWFTEFTISELSKTVSVYFWTCDFDLVDTIRADFDEINKTETPIHLALRLFNQIEKRGSSYEHFEKTV